MCGHQRYSETKCSKCGQLYNSDYQCICEINTKEVDTKSGLKRIVIPPVELGKRLKLIRKLKRMSIADVTHGRDTKIDLPFGALEKIEAGDLDELDVYTFYYLCELYDVDMEDVLLVV